LTGYIAEPASRQARVCLMKNRGFASDGSGNFPVERLMDFLIALGQVPSIREECKDCYARPRRSRTHTSSAS
jgi:hypothetical protein